PHLSHMKTERAFLSALILVLIGVAFLMVKPLLGYLIGAVLLGFLLHPLQERLEPKLGEKVSAFSLVILTVLLAILPLSVAGFAVAEDAKDFAQDVQETDLINYGGIEQQIKSYTGQDIDLEKEINQAVKGFTTVTIGGFSKAIGLAAQIVIGMFVMLFLVYYILKDGEQFVIWLKEATPLPAEMQDILYERLSDTTWAVIQSHVLVAVAQGLAGGLGLALAGIPNYIFWTFVMIILGFIPVVGATLVWIPAAIYLFIIGSPAAAVFLTLYGFFVVGLIDNFLRPILVDRTAKLNPAVIILGVIGGVYVFGAAGLFLGPIILGALKAALTVFKNNYPDVKVE
ncbi:MAG: AI-2E family transporter, partial [Candidatus Nanohaloarchaea archaeon]